MSKQNSKYSKKEYEDICPNYEPAIHCDCDYCLTCKKKEKIDNCPNSNENFICHCGSCN